MTIPIASQLRDYRRQLADWIRRKGPEGGGGSWDRNKRQYNRMPEPSQPQNISAFEKKAFDAVRAEVMKDAPKPQPDPNLRKAA